MASGLFSLSPAACSRRDLTNNVLQVPVEASLARVSGLAGN
jgi:hypothetical protein